VASEVERGEPWQELVAMVNAQFESPQFRRLLALRFTNERAQFYAIQYAHFVKNRRDCWGFVQGGAPMDVKRLVWEHEREELVGDAAAGKADHVALAVQEGIVLGLAQDDFERTPPTDTAVVCFHAWRELARSRPWLEAVAASAVLEMRNSDELVRGGGLSRRIGEKLQADLGIPLRRLVNTAEHVEADVDHARLLLRVIERHVRTPEDREAVVRGARESLTVDRVFRGELADGMAALP
jgi:pyrroloquinoline quinone (PQQ) biosynthesis protein C